MKELRHFRLLMWKHYHLRKHKWFMTAVEIFLPIIIAYLLCAHGGRFLSIKPETKSAIIAPAYTTKQFMDSPSFFHLAFAPANDFTRKIVEKTNQLAHFQITQPFENENQIETFLSQKSGNYYEQPWIGVVFMDTSNSDTKPSKLSYKIRHSYPWKTDQLYREVEKSGPPLGDMYFIYGLAGVQIALDTAYIQQWDANFQYNDILFQAFPYPEYTTMNELRFIVPLLIFFAVVLTSLMLSVPFIGSLIEEKETGIKELMKLNGVKEWIIQWSWFLNAIILNLFSFTIVSFILQFEFNGAGSAVLTNVPVWIGWLSIILYCVANIAFCFTFSAIFHSFTVATSIFILLYSLLIYGSTKVQTLNSSYLTKLTCFSPVGAFYQAFRRISYLENQQQPLTWLSLNSVDVELEGVSLLFALLMLIFDTCLYLLLANYISAINPGTFGSRKSPFFFIETLLPTSKGGTRENFNDFEDNEEPKHFEKPPRNLEVSIRIKSLHKCFGSVHAIRGVNLNVYKGEITALLGHNGAGKTTTMSILTGMTRPTAGSITYKNDIDVLKEMERFRQNLGLCPQEDRLFPYLSVLNHLLFFGMLKGVSKTEALNEANEYLNLMEMTSKANNLSRSLSGGMKRKLSLSIALMGKVDTLILDEPTSGMDVESRRKVWDLLLEMRGNRTIILTTHHMEEADVLGDRIAIMNHGMIVCHGTTLFLKKTYGTGYQVTITRNINNNEDLTKVFQSYVPNSEKEAESRHEIVFKLPLTETAKYPELFRILEEQKNNLGIVNIGVSCTTMEQVFLKVGDISLHENKRSSSNNNAITNGNYIPESPRRKKSGLGLILQQFRALFLKKFLFMRRNMIKFFFRVLLPTLIMMFMLYGSIPEEEPEKPIALSLSTYPQAKIMLTEVKTDRSRLYDGLVEYAQKHGATFVHSEVGNIIDGLLDYSRKSMSSFQRELLLAATFNQTHSLTLFSEFAYHSLPVLINTMSNVQLKLITKDDKTINAVNFPVEAIKESCSMNGSEIMIWFLALAFYSIDLCYFFSYFLSAERIDGFKHIQRMSNLSTLMYWISNFIFDFLFFFLFVALRILCYKLIDDRKGFLAFQPPMEILLFLLAEFIASGLLFTYVTNFVSRSKDGSYALLLIVNILAAIVVFSFYYIQMMVWKNKGKIDSFIFPIPLYYFFKYFIFLVPSLNYSLAFLKFIIIWLNNVLAKKSVCQEKVSTQKYLVFASTDNPNGLLEEIIFMGIDIILYSVLLGVIEAGYFSVLANKFVSIVHANSGSRFAAEGIDPDVVAEKNRVHSRDCHPSRRNCTGNTYNSVELRGGQENVVLLAQNLKKVFLKKTSTFVAVRDVNFAVRAGECFGLLGVNGAGKSTTFKMLTGTSLPTRGDSSIQNIRLSKNRNKYLTKAGYCAQTNCFIEELTGREMLTLIATLRGVCSDQVKPLVNKWLTILGLESYQNQRCGDYSGGNKRKLCTAMSLIGDPAIVFLDEPTTGVDPVSRRKLYDVMEHSKTSGQAVILTSHSMEECENLCDRLTIMTKGQMKCIGTAQHLKQRYAQGFSVLIKTRDMPDEEERITALKNNLLQAFHSEYCFLKDEHKGLLYYQIADVQLKWCQLFQTLENLKNDCEIIEDYTVTDTSLEEVFMSFAKQV